MMNTNVESHRQVRAGEVLKRDHERLDQLFEQLIAALQADVREDGQRLWTKFEAGLREHMDLEERAFFPRFSEVEPVEAHALLAEHRAIREQLVELGVGLDLHLTRADVVCSFIERLRAHARREEALFYRCL
jgi:hemerythrin superfamily protein